jgi:hypothetical protein
MRILKIFLFTAISAILFSACSGKKMVVSGIVTDSGNKALSEAYVFAGSQMVQTDEDGTFLFEAVDADDARPLLKITKKGYFTIIRALNADEPVNQIRVQLLAHDNTEVGVHTCRISDFANPAELTSSNGTLLRLNASDIDGDAMESSVFLAIIDPQDVNQVTKVQGSDFKAGKNNEFARLRCYAMAMIDIVSKEGKILNLKKNASAEIKFPVPAVLSANPPASTGLWHFNEATGIWESNGKAELKDGYYTAVVNHFSTWGIGESSDEIAFLEGRVTDRNGRGVAGVLLSADQTAVITDDYGNYKALIPAQRECKVEMNYRGFMISLLCEATEAGKKTRMDLSVPPMTYVKGEAIGCNGKGSAAQITITWGDEDFSQIYTKNGIFELSLPTAVANFEITLKTRKSTVKKSFANKTEQSAINAGKIIVCLEEQDDESRNNRNEERLDGDKDKQDKIPEKETKDEKPVNPTSKSYLVIDGGAFRDYRVPLNQNLKAYREQHYNYNTSTTDIILNIEAESRDVKGFSWYLFLHDFKTGLFHVRPPEVSNPPGIEIYSGIKINGLEISFLEMEVKIISIGNPGEPIAGSIIFKNGSYRNPDTNELFSNITAVGEFSFIRSY